MATGDLQSGSCLVAKSVLDPGCTEFSQRLHRSKSCLEFAEEGGGISSQTLSYASPHNLTMCEDKEQGQEQGEMGRRGRIRGAKDYRNLASHEDKARGQIEGVLRGYGIRAQGETQIQCGKQ